MADGPARARKRFAVAALSALAALVALEVVGRFGLPFGIVRPLFGHPPAVVEQVREFLRSGATTGQVADPHMVYRLNGPGVNALGFRDVPFRIEKTADTTRIACIGASTTEGGSGVSYPEHLEQVLRERSHSAEVMNWGVSGWTSAESLVNYVLLVQDYRPDVVLIHHAVNDVPPRVWPDFQPDYGHFRVVWRAPHIAAWERWLAKYSDFWVALQVRRCLALSVDRFAVRPWPAGDTASVDSLKEVLPDSFDRNIRTLCAVVRRHGGKPVLITMPAQPEDLSRGQMAWRRAGVQEHNEVLRQIAAEERLALVDLAKRFDERSDRLGVEFGDLVHLSSRGRRAKAAMIAGALERRELIPSARAPETVESR